MGYFRDIFSATKKIQWAWQMLYQRKKFWKNISWFQMIFTICTDIYDIWSI